MNYKLKHDDKYRVIRIDANDGNRNSVTRIEYANDHTENERKETITTDNGFFVKKYNENNELIWEERNGDIIEYHYLPSGRISCVDYLSKGYSEYFFYNEMGEAVLSYGTDEDEGYLTTRIDCLEQEELDSIKDGTYEIHGKLIDNLNKAVYCIEELLEGEVMSDTISDTLKDVIELIQEVEEKL